MTARLQTRPFEEWAAPDEICSHAEAGSSAFGVARDRFSSARGVRENGVDLKTVFLKNRASHAARLGRLGGALDVDAARHARAAAVGRNYGLALSGVAKLALNEVRGGARVHARVRVGARGGVRPRDLAEGWWGVSE
jgi:hypothetical protein